MISADIRGDEAVIEQLVISLADAMIARIDPAVFSPARFAAG